MNSPLMIRNVLDHLTTAQNVQKLATTTDANIRNAQAKEVIEDTDLKFITALVHIRVSILFAIKGGIDVLSPCEAYEINVRKVGRVRCLRLK